MSLEFQKIEVSTIGLVGIESREIQARGFDAWIIRTSKHGQKHDKNQTQLSSF